MEPIKQLIQISTPTHFRETYRAGDNQESFLAYLGQAQASRQSQEASEDNEALKLELSPLARMMGSLSSEGRQALIAVLEMLPQSQESPRQLAQLISTLLSEHEMPEIEPDLVGLEQLLTRISSENGNGRLNVATSLRELAELPETSQKFFFETLDGFLNLSSRDLSGLLANRDGLSETEYKDFLNVLSNLLKRGVIGTEEIRVRDQKRRTFVTTRLGDSTVRHAESYRRGRYPLDRSEREK